MHLEVEGIWLILDTLKERAMENPNLRSLFEHDIKQEYIMNALRIIYTKNGPPQGPNDKRNLIVNRSMSLQQYQDFIYLFIQCYFEFQTEYCDCNRQFLYNHLWYLKDYFVMEHRTKKSSS